jgi:CRP-like cAMP-binding protein
MPVDPARLRPVPLFEGIHDADVTMIAEHMEERLVSPGEHLTREGASGYFFFVILDGTASVERQGELLAELGPGDFFGEGAILEATRRNATVTATSDMTLGALFGADFAKYEHDSPELHARITKVMADRKIVDA